MCFPTTDNLQTTDGRFCDVPFKRFFGVLSPRLVKKNHKSRDSSPGWAVVILLCGEITSMVRNFITINWTKEIRMETFLTGQSLREERINSITHALGILFGLVCIPILILSACENCGSHVIAGTAIYAFSFLMVFTFSSLFHWQTNSKIRRLFLILDHISIYFLIAGTYTPFILIFINNSFGIMMLAALWGLTLLGVFFKIFYTGRFEIISTMIYLLMGWMLLTGAWQFFENMPSPIIILIITGAILYSVGVIFYIKRLFMYHHAVWHLFVLSAAICHFTAVMLSVPA